MANLDAPRGFRLLQQEGKTVRSREYTKVAAAVIFKGDLLMRVPSGEINVWLAGTIAAAGIPVGVASHSADATKSTIGVWDDPEASYRCQTSDVYATADNGLNADVAAAPSPDTGLNVSGQEIDMSTKAATAALPFKVMELAPKLNDAENGDGANADIVVKINNLERGAGTTGIA